MNLKSSKLIKCPPPSFQRRKTDRSVKSSNKSPVKKARNYAAFSHMKENSRISLFKLLFTVCFISCDHMWYLLQLNFTVAITLLLAFGAF